MKELIRHWIYKTMGISHFVRQIEWRNMLEWLDPRENERILDVACGGGTLSLKIAEKGCKVYGIDISEDAINHAKRSSERERIPCEFEVGDAEDLPYPNEYFDKVVCSSSLEHFKNDVEALKEMYRGLKPNGSVVLTTDSFSYPISDELKGRHRQIHYVVNYYTEETLKKRFRISGFEMRRSEYLLSSRVTSFFFNHLFIKWRRPGILRMMISLFLYPLCLMSDRLFGVKDKEYTLITEEEKDWK